MKLKEYAQHIALLAQRHPYLEVIHSGDDEGNYYYPVHYTPTIGHFSQGEFKSKEETLKENGNGDGGFVNAICIN